MTVPAATVATRTAAALLLMAADLLPAVVGNGPLLSSDLHTSLYSAVRMMPHGDDPGRLRLHARSGAEVTTAYPELTALGGALEDAVLDGEIVVLDGAGRPSFTALAERMHVREKGRAARLAASLPVSYMIFDLLQLDGRDLTAEPY